MTKLSLIIGLFLSSISFKANAETSGHVSLTTPRQTKKTLRPAPVVFDHDSKREPATTQAPQTPAEPPADLSAEKSWYGERSANAIESLLRAISN